MLDTLLTKGYKEHLKCVCGSDKKTKNCHGDDMHLIYKSLTREELKYEKNQVFSYLEELKMAQPIKMLSALRNKADRKSSRR